MYSPSISLDIMTVKIGAELFTVSANDTATLFRLTSPNTTVENLQQSKEEKNGKKKKSECMIYYSRKDVHISTGHKQLT